MQNLVFTQLSVPEVRQLFRDELRAFFRDKRNIDAMCAILNRVSTYKDDTRIEDLNMSVTLYNGLKSRKINTLGEMKALEWKKFKGIRGVGIKSWDEMQDIINLVK